MKTGTTIITLLLLGVIMGARAPEANAQWERHLVTIQDGKLFVDGHRVPDNELPASLKIENLSANMSFTGDALLELNGEVYQLVDGKLVEADENTARDGRVTVFFRDPDNEEAVVRVLTRESGDVHAFGQARVKSEGAYGVVMEDYYDALENKAREFEVIQGQLLERNSDEAFALADKLRLEAENTARMAKAFPRVEFESYLEGIQQSNLSLYNQLVEERSLESETYQLARDARAASTERERDMIVDELRRKLEEAFELKQQNREREIEQLAEKLDELRQRITERSEARDRIIDARLRELLGELDW